MGQMGMYIIEMGSGQSTTSIYVCLSELNNYKIKQDHENNPLEFSQLLKVSQIQKIDEHEVKLQRNNHQYFIIKTYSPVEELMEYEGCLTILDKSGNRLYEGVVKKGKKEQYGKQYNSKGELIYEGQYVNDCYQGWGKTKYYKGQYLKGKRHGWGIYQDPDKKIKYQGMFQEGLFQGVGFLNVPEEEVRDYMQQNKFFLDQTIDVKYVGEWSQGRLTGRGKLVTRGHIYNGDFKNGQLQGEGKLVEKSGKVSEGKFYMGMHI